MGIFEKFKLGFKRSADKLSEGFREIVIKKEIDDKKLNEIEEFLISSDVGIEASSKIKSIISQRKIDPSLNPISEINSILKQFIISLMKPLEKKDFFNKKSEFKSLKHNFDGVVCELDLLSAEKYVWDNINSWESVTKGKLHILFKT